jgi:hypothetical protein
MALAVPGCGDDATPVRNSQPVIDSLTAHPATIDALTATNLSCWAHDPDGDELYYVWSAFTGTITGSGPAIKWIAPRAVGTHWVFVTVEDLKGGSASDTVLIEVLEPPDSLARAMFTDTS